MIARNILHMTKCDKISAILYILYIVYPLPNSHQVLKRCHRQSHSNDTQTMYSVLDCFQESRVEEIMRSFWGNKK